MVCGGVAGCWVSAEGTGRSRVEAAAGAPKDQVEPELSDCLPRYIDLACAPERTNWSIRSTSLIQRPTFAPGLYLAQRRSGVLMAAGRAAEPIDRSDIFRCDQGVSELRLLRRIPHSRVEAWLHVSSLRRTGRVPLRQRWSVARTAH